MTTATEEQETVIHISRNSDTAKIWTSDSTAMTRLDKNVQKNPEEWKLEKVERFTDGSISGKWYCCPKRLISYRAKTATRELTEEQRKEIGERLNKINSMPRN